MFLFNTHTHTLSLSSLNIYIKKMLSSNIGIITGSGGKQLKSGNCKLSKHEIFMKKVYEVGVKSGDLCFFEGYTTTEKLTQLVMINCPFCHVVLFLKKDDKMYVLESKRGGTEGLLDYIEKDKKDGVSLSLLDSRLISIKDNYSIGIRKISSPFTDKQNDKIFELYKKHQHKPFQKGKMEMILSWYDGPFGKNKEDLSSFFCSEWVVLCFKELGLIKTKLPCNEFTPGDLFRMQMNQTDGENIQFYENVVHVIKK